MESADTILRSYLNLIMPDGSFLALEANGKQDRKKALRIALDYGAQKAVLHYCHQNAEIGKADVLFDDKNDGNYSSNL